MATIRNGNRAVLLVVDFQIDVVKDGWDAARVGANLAQAVARARARGTPVIWVQHEAEDLPHGSAGWQFAPGLVPDAGEARVYKKYNSAFEETPLEAELARLGATRLVLAGAMTNWCIRSTAYAALERGYDLTLLTDAHTTSDLDMRNGTVRPAPGIVDDLNVAMNWVAYPGRVARTATAAEVEFG
jgi:nicotinamidase-related amidase